MLPFAMTFQEKLSRLLVERRMDLRLLSEASGLSYEGVRNYVRAGTGRVPSAQNGIALARALKVTAEWLFDDSREWPPPDWPPNGLSWQELQAAVWAFVYQRELDRFWANSGPKVRLMEGNRELRNVRPDRFLKMIDSPAAIQDAIHAIRLAAADQSNAKKGHK